MNDEQSGRAVGRPFTAAGSSFIDFAFSFIISFHDRAEIDQDHQHGDRQAHHGHDHAVIQIVDHGLCLQLDARAEIVAAPFAAAVIRRLERFVAGVTEQQPRPAGSPLAAGGSSAWSKFGAGRFTIRANRHSPVAALWAQRLVPDLLMILHGRHAGIGPSWTICRRDVADSLTRFVTRPRFPRL